LHVKVHGGRVGFRVGTGASLQILPRVRTIVARRSAVVKQLEP
jgi:hypothetical protein